MSPTFRPSKREPRPSRRRRAPLSRAHRWETLGGRMSGLESLEARMPLAADLGVTIDAAHVWYMPGTEATYTVAVTNLGPDDASGVAVSTVLGSQINRSTWTAEYPTGGSGPVVGAGNVAATISLPAGKTARFSVVATIGPTASGPLTSTASVSRAGDPNPGNDSATDTLAFVPRHLVLADDAGWTSTSAVRVIDAETQAERARFFAYEPGYRGGVQAILADVDDDGRPDVVTTPGRGRDGEIRVFTLDGAERPEFRTQPFGPGWRGGVNLGVGHVDGDGRIDFVAAKASGDGEVRVFRGQAGPDPVADVAYRTFQPFAATFLGGATVAVADVGTFANGDSVDAGVPDGRNEVLVGCGPTREAEVQVRDLSSPSAPVIDVIRPFNNPFLGGVAVTTARVNLDSIPDVVIAAGRRGAGEIEAYDGRVGAAANARLAAFTAFASTARSFDPTAASAVDSDGDGRADAFYAARAGQAVQRFSAAGALLGTGPEAGRIATPPAPTNRTLVTTPSGLRYLDLVVGTGPKPSSSTARVRVDYEGRLLDGTRFDGNTNTSFTLDGVIAGWTEGLATMAVGGRRQLVIPANLAYGSTARPGIPANSTLVFDVRLLETN